MWDKSHVTYVIQSWCFSLSFAHSFYSPQEEDQQVRVSEHHPYPSFSLAFMVQAY